MANEKKTIADFPAKDTPGNSDLWPFWDFVQENLVQLSTTKFVQFLSQHFLKTEDLAPVALSGQYDDLEGLPSIPAAYTDAAAIAAAKTNIGTSSTQFAAGDHSHLQDLEFYYPEASNYTIRERKLTRKIQIQAVDSTSQISSVAYFVKVDTGSYVSKATYSDINDWIVSNSPVKYWIKVVQTPIAGAAGVAQHTMVYKEIA